MTLTSDIDPNESYDPNARITNDKLASICADYIWRFFDDKYEVFTVYDVITQKPITLDLKFLIDGFKEKQQIKTDEDSKRWNKKYIRIIEVQSYILRELQTDFNNAIDCFKIGMGIYVMEKFLPTDPRLIKSLTEEPTRFIKLRLKPHDDDFLEFKSIGYEYENKAIAVKGEVQTVYDTQGLIKQPAYTCDSDEHQGLLYAHEGETLSICEEHNCKVRIAAPQYHIKSDLQLITIKEKDADKKAAEIQVWLTDDLCWSVYQGMSVTVYGKLLYAQLKNNNNNTMNIVLKKYLFANNIYESSESKQRFQLTPQDIQEFERESQKDYFYDTLVKSCVPNIEGNYEAKQACVNAVCCIGTPLTKNVWLLGDPSAGKSDTIDFFCFVTEKSAFMNGAGINDWSNWSAYARKDPETQQYRVDDGTILRARNGLVAVDEAHNMNTEISSKLNEWLESNRVTYSKGGETRTVYVNTKNIFASNSAFGRYDPKKSLQENMKFLGENRDALMSRFTDIIVFIDEKDPEKDKKAAENIIDGFATPEDRWARYMEDYTDPRTKEKRYGIIKLCKIFKWIQSLAIPVPSKELKEFASQDFVDIRQEKDEISQLITYRYLKAEMVNAIIYARIHNRKTATIEDYNHGCKIVRDGLKAISYDPETKTYDTSQLENRKGKADNIKYTNKEDSLIFAIKEMLVENIKINNTSDVLIGYNLRHRAATKSENFQGRPHAFISMLKSLDRKGVAIYDELGDKLKIDRTKFVEKYGELDADTK